MKGRQILCMILFQQLLASSFLLLLLLPSFNSMAPKHLGEVERGARDEPEFSTLSSKITSTYLNMRRVPTITNAITHTLSSPLFRFASLITVVVGGGIQGASCAYFTSKLSPSTKGGVNFRTSFSCSSLTPLPCCFALLPSEK